MSSWLALDIETRNPEEAHIQAAIDAWKAPSTWKQETVEAKRQSAADRIREKSALLDTAPIICIGVMTSGGEQILFSGMPEPIGAIAGWQVINAGSEPLMLLALREWLNAAPFAEEPALVGCHLQAFDLCKLRLAYLQAGLRLPELLRPRLDGETPVRVVDVAHLVKSFSTQYRDEFMISLDRTASILGIDRPKQIINGADIPDLYRQGQYQSIGVYCAIDVTTTARAFLLMTGQAPDLT